MILVYEFPSNEKAKLSALLEADPYGEKSFSRNGYKMKEGASVGLESGKCYLYIKCTEDFAPFAREKLKGNADECKPDAASKVAKAIEDEENSAEQGFGSIFGE